VSTGCFFFFSPIARFFVGQHSINKTVCPLLPYFRIPVGWYTQFMVQYRQKHKLCSNFLPRSLTC
jgi:hypothetical protein